MRTIRKKQMQENELKTVNRMKAYQKLAERTIQKKRHASHMNRRG